MMEIAIRSVPPGEAPENIRAAWVGLMLPVHGNGPVSTRGAGVLSGPRSRLTRLLYVLLQRGQQEQGFLVEAPVAFERLDRHAPSAAMWWKQNTPHLNRPGQFLLFHEAVCEVIESSSTGQPHAAFDNMTWNAFEHGKSLGTIGSEGGVIRRDEENNWGARITLEERGAVAPCSITCGIYGWFFHTRFLKDGEDGDREFDRMRDGLGDVLRLIPSKDEAAPDKMAAVSSAIEAFVDRFQ